MLCAMFASSHLLDPTMPRGARLSLQAGTALFLASDTVLAFQEFVLDEPRPWVERGLARAAAFTWERAAGRYEDVYRELLAG